MLTTQEEADKAKYRICSGWTCYRHITAEPLYDGYLMLHHKSHREWVNRETGSRTCEAWHVLVHVSTERASGLIENSAIKCFKGRMTRLRYGVIDDSIRLHKKAREEGRQ